MRAVFHQELNDVQHRLVDIAELVHAAISRAITALTDADIAAAEQVIAADTEIDRRTQDLDELITTILARQAPVATDLRVLVSALRVSASLERMGDLAEHIAHLARIRFPDPVIPHPLRPTFQQMGALDITMATTLVALLRQHDPQLADQIRNDDNTVDELHAGVFRTLLNPTWAEDAASTVDITLASRYHERFADHAVSIATKIGYLTTGTWTHPSA